MTPRDSRPTPSAIGLTQSVQVIKVRGKREEGEKKVGTEKKEIENQIKKKEIIEISMNMYCLKIANDSINRTP